MNAPVPSSWRLRDAPLNWAAHSLLPFYRRFPYAGQMPITKVDPRGVVIPTERVFYNRIPKAANSTVVAELAAQSAYRPLLERGTDAKSRFPRPSHMGRAMVDDLARDWFTCTLVRHPVTRTLSAYLDKIAGRTMQSRLFYRWFGTEREPSFTDFCRYLQAGGLWHDMHWAPQSGILLLPLERFDLIGRFERLEEDLGRIVTQGFGPDHRLVFRRAGPGPTGAGERAATLVTDEARDILARLFAEDFRAFGYDPAA